ncbi:MAG: tetratricopeptide repeat protein [Myxococcota bacterium]|nr:tetratricopeptide repeat protein [Myxococcota bacterium]
MKAFSDTRRFGSPVSGRLSALILALTVAVGCASSPFSHEGRKASAPSGAVVRPEMGVEYDILVGEMAVREGDFELAQGAFGRALEKDPTSAPLHFRQAELLAQSDDIVGATQLAQQGMALDPDDIDGRLLAGRLYRLQRDFPGVQRALLNEQGEAISLDASLLLYQVYLENGQLKEALALALDLESADPDNLGAAMAVATTYERMGRLDEAEAALSRALAYHPDRFVLYARLARMRRARGDRDGEIELYQEVLSEYPEHYGTLISLGEAQIAHNDFEGAIATHARILELYPDDPEVLRRLASLEFGAGRYEDAAQRLRQAKALYPEHPEFTYSLGQVLRALSDPDGAILAFDDVGQGHPLYLEARLQIAIVYEEEGRPEQALEELEALRALRPDAGLDFHVATLRARVGDVKGGVALLNSLLEKNPDDEEVLYQLGVIYGNQNDVDQALAYMERVLEVNPQNAQALNYVGYTWAERGQHLDQAERMIRQAVRLSPRDGYIVDSLGWVYYMQAQPLLAEGQQARGVALLEKAVEQLVLAIELTGGDPVVSEHLGDVYLQMGLPNQALQYYEEALQLRPQGIGKPELQKKIDGLRESVGSGSTPQSGSSSQ